MRKMLAAHDYPNFSSESKLRLVIDEAQILSDKNPTSFASSSSERDPRPMLSPVLQAFQLSGTRYELTIIYCGTGMSIWSPFLAMGYGSDIKECGSEIFPSFEFPGWTNPDSIQSYIGRVKEQLPDDEMRRMVDTLIPPKRLTGRFRPIVTAIESIIETGKWETAIDNTETMITTWKDRDRRRNMCGRSPTTPLPSSSRRAPLSRKRLGCFFYAIVYWVHLRPFLGMTYSWWKQGSVASKSSEVSQEP